MGKTRLGLQIAAELQDTFTHGSCCVSLASIRDAEMVFPTIAQSLHLPTNGTQPLVEQVKVSLREQHLLLVLDGSVRTEDTEESIAFLAILIC